MIKNIIVFGGRDYRERGIAFDAFDHLHARPRTGPIRNVVHGDAPGADSQGHVWATLRRLKSRPVMARWNDIDAPGAVIAHGKFGPYNKLAGFWRNQEIIDRYGDRVDYAVAFPGGSGTADMRRRVEAAGIPIIEVYAYDFSAHCQARLAHLDAKAAS